MARSPKNRARGSFKIMPPAEILPPTEAPPVYKPFRMLEASSGERKCFPITSGVLDYFPDAITAVAEVSFVGNMKHNPGQALHWARGKSMDHPDCIGRHLIERGGFEVVEINGKKYLMRHSASLAWRALANLQEELEREKGFGTPRGAVDL